MSTATLQRPSEFDALAADNDNFDLNEGQLDIHVRRAVARMIAFCEGNSAAATFLARGLVIDTLGDINQQIHDYFPKHIDVSPIIDDISFVVASAAKKSNQRFQEVSLGYIADGKIPEQENANKQSFVKWYSVDGTSNGGGFDGFKKDLKPGYSGGAGGSGADMLKHLNLGTKKGFLLVVASLDIADAHAQSLMADIGMVQAFGTAPATLNAVADVMAAGGTPAKQMDTAIQQMVEIKILKAALVDAGTSPQAAVIATALALKTEALAVSLPNIQAAVPPAAAVEITRQIDGVKVDMAATQMARAIDSIANSALPANNVSTAPLIHAVEAVKAAAAASNLSVADVVALVMTHQAPPALTEPMRAMTAILSKPEVLPAIERSVPQAVAASIRADLVTPPLALAATTPVMPQPIVEALSALGQKTGIPTLTQAADAMQSTIPMVNAAPASVPPTMTVQAVVENLQAMTLSRNVPPEIKAQIAVIVPQVEAMVIQLRDPAPVMVPQVVPVAVPATGPVPISQVFAAPSVPAPFVATGPSTVTPPSVIPPSVTAASVTPVAEAVAPLSIPPVGGPVVVGPVGGPPVAVMPPVIAAADVAPVMPASQPAVSAKGPSQYDSQYGSAYEGSGRAQVALSPYSPLAMTATASGGTAPGYMAPAPSQYGNANASSGHPYAQAQGGTSGWTPRADNNNGPSFRTGAGTAVSYADATSPIQAGNSNQAAKPASGKGCTTCTRGFNCASCGVLSSEAMKTITQDATQSQTLTRRYGHG